MHQPTAEQEAAGFVLAGGRSSRMGTDKALVEFRGRPLVANALGILRGAGLSASIAGSRSALESFAPVVPDSQPDQGPLSGICAAMASNYAHYAVFLPVDLPLLPSALVEYLVNSARLTENVVTLASITGFPQTFPAVLDRAVLPILQSELEAGRLGCFSAFRAASASFGQPISVIATESIVQAGLVAHPDGLPPFRWFLNLNQEDDLHRARAVTTAAR
jgi:molybdopterin-guanine dinucleotide biosynthesis protein A